MNAVGTLIAELRLLVGFLGEKEQGAWWKSEFLSPSAQTFLSPIFVRSLSLAQYHGVTAAAANVHDAVIGVGRIYHLFRLPIGLEQASSDSFNDATFVQEVQKNLVGKELALTRLVDLAEQMEAVSPGPVLLGSMSDDIRAELKRAAGFYHAALNSGIQTFPYIREVE